MGSVAAPAPRLVPLGDRAILVEFETRIDPAINERALTLADTLDRQRLPGIRFVAPAFCSVSVGWLPEVVDRAEVCRWVQRALSTLASPAPRPARPPVVVPVCYEGPCAPDLQEVAQHTGLTPTEVIRLHAETPYRVFMLGFLPGFAYLGTLPPQLVVSRRATPRTRVAAGSVGLAGQQTGVYPFSVPGGWQIIGQTPLVPFAEPGVPGFGWRPGDEVRFQPISLAEFEASTEGDA